MNTRLLLSTISPSYPIWGGNLQGNYLRILGGINSEFVNAVSTNNNNGKSPHLNLFLTLLRKFSKQTSKDNLRYALTPSSYPGPPSRHGACHYNPPNRLVALCNVCGLPTIRSPSQASIW